MKFILAPDSFKESMTARQACTAMEKGIKKAMPEAQCIPVPMADGGEGTMQALVDTTGGTIFRQTVMGPLGDPVTGEFAVLGDGVTGVVEIASASGLHLVPSAKRDPMVTTTYGTGELIKAALDRGIKKLIIGLGGSGTNDGGVGMVQALGVRFMDKDGSEIGRGGGELIKIAVIDTSRLEAALRSVRVEIACDVTNPLTGENGASRVFGPQKGATGEAIMELDRNLEHLAGKIKEYMGKDIKHVPGTGAAGGSGAGLMAFLDAKLVQGIDVIMEHSGLEEKMKSADYVFTGEGSLDRQTLYGKTISGVINLSRRYDIPVVAFAGRVSHADILYQSGLAAVFSILPSVCTLEEALKNGEENLETTVYSVVRLMNAGIKK